MGLKNPGLLKGKIPKAVVPKGFLWEQPYIRIGTVLKKGVFTLRSFYFEDL